MKEVCRQTGLTDRTVRYYIECGLLAPISNDNYAGRKNFTFTREDVERLEQIKILRSAGFGVEHIKMLLGGHATNDIVSERLQELETEREKSAQLLDALQKANIDRDVSLEELTIILSNHPTAWEEETQSQPFDRFPYWVLWVVPLVLHIVLWCADIGRLNWIIEFRMLLWLDAAEVIGVIAARKHANWKRYSVIIGACVLIPLVSVVSGLMHVPKMLNKTHYAMIDQIPWDNTLYLQRHGFDKVGNTDSVLDYDIRTLIPDKEEAQQHTQFTLNVQRRMSEDTFKYPIQYGDSCIRESVGVHYDSVIKEWLRIPNSVDRSYWIVSKGKKITLWDWNNDAPNDVTLIERILNDLCKDIDKIGVAVQPDANAAAIVNGVSISNDAVNDRLRLNQVRNRAFTDLYNEVYPNEIDREYYLQKSLRADDREGVLQELIRAEVIRGLLATYDTPVSYEDAVTAYEAEHLQMRKDESQHAFYAVLQEAMRVYDVGESELMQLSYTMQQDTLNEKALKRWFSKSAWYFGGYLSLTEQFEEYVDKRVELAELMIVR